MTRPLLIIRPQPDADATAERARALGLEPRLYPLFDAAPLDWQPPDPGRFDAVLLTSANTIRHGGEALARYRHLPVYAVGARTAEAARSFGFPEVVTAGPDAQTTVRRMSEEGHRAVFHPGGAHVRAVDPDALDLLHVPVYHMVESGKAEGLAAALHDRPVVLVHSPRAGERLRALIEEASMSQIGIVAISPAALDACGPGWGRAVAAETPDDPAMLALTRQICHKAPMSPSAPGLAGQE